MSESAKPREPQVAVAPLNTIDAKDVGRGAAEFDAWLQSISGGTVTLERIKSVAGALPVVARIEALWHRRSDPDAGVSWLVGELAAGAAEAVGMSAAPHAGAAGKATVEAPPAGQAQTGE